MTINEEAFLTTLFETAVSAAHPDTVMADYLPDDKSGNAIVIGAGKAAGSMAKAFESCWEGPIRGLVVTRYNHSDACEHIEVVEAGHPMPDDAGRDVANRIMRLVEGLSKTDHVFVLISGGGSSLLSLPAPGISFEEKQAINKSLLRSGASISDMNCVRKHLSAIKGGRLLAACQPAKVHTFAISDVPGDEASVIASGPTVPDSSTSQMALDILRRYDISVSDSVVSWLNSPESETLKPDEVDNYSFEYYLIAKPQQSIQAAAKYAQRHGIAPLVLGDSIEGESRDVANVHAGITKQIIDYRQPIKPPCVILSGGETTVTVKGNGRGGRNAEFLLSFFIHAPEDLRITAIAADTDGIDGSEDNAGCVLVNRTREIVKSKHLNAQEYLDNNDGYGFFEAAQSLLKTGPTRTNVNDFRAILIL